MENHTASYIAMPAAEGQTGAFAEFLAGAAAIVRDTETLRLSAFLACGQLLRSGKQCDCLLDVVRLGDAAFSSERLDD